MKLLVTLIPIFNNNLISLSAARQCNVPEIAQFTHDDVNAVVKFIAEKDCQITDQQIIDSTDFLENLDQHGCWCNAINSNTDNPMLRYGSPVDDVDKSCKTWKKCEKCCNQHFCSLGSNGDFGPFEIEYNDNGQFGCIGENECMTQRCLCHLELALSVSEAIFSGNYQGNQICQTFARSPVVPKDPSSAEKSGGQNKDSKAPTTCSALEIVNFTSTTENTTSADDLDENRIQAQESTTTTSPTTEELTTTTPPPTPTPTQDYAGDICTSQCPDNTNWTEPDCMFGHPTDQTQFYKCDHGVAYLFDCPAGLVWDQSIFVCNWP